MSFLMTEEQELLQQSVHEFCMDPVTLKAIEEDNKKPGSFPMNTWKLLVDMGYVGISVPEEYGGQGQSVVSELIVVEALNQHGYPAVENLAGHTLGMAILRYWGSEEIKRKYLVPCAKGAKVCCGAVTDPAGSCNMTEWGITLQEDGDELVVNGNKVIVTNADTADVKVILCRRDGTGVMDRAVIVEKTMPGVETGYQEKRIIPTPQDWGSISLKNVRVPKENLMLATEIGTKWNALGFNMGALMALGLGQGAFAMAMDYTSQRTTCGHPLNQLQSVAHRLVNIAISNEISRASIYTAARLWDEGKIDESARLSYMNKVFVTEAMARNTHDATILHGGIGYTMQSMVGIMNAMVVSAEIAECPPDVLRDAIARTYGIEPIWTDNRP